MLRIKNILKEKGLTQSDLANKMGITRISIVKTLAGNPTIETLQKIADVLQVDILDLFDDKRHDKSNNLTCPHCNKPINVELR